MLGVSLLLSLERRDRASFSGRLYKELVVITSLYAAIAPLQNVSHPTTETVPTTHPPLRTHFNWSLAVWAAALGPHLPSKIPLVATNRTLRQETTGLAQKSLILGELDQDHIGCGNMSRKTCQGQNVFNAKNGSLTLFLY